MGSTALSRMACLMQRSYTPRNTADNRLASIQVILRFRCGERPREPENALKLYEDGSPGASPHLKIRRANRFGSPVELMVSNLSAQPSNSPRICQHLRRFVLGQSEKSRRRRWDWNQKENWIFPRN